MSRRRDVHRFDRWARTYDRHWMQRAVFAPVQRTVMEVAAAEVERPATILDVGCGTGRLLRSAEERFGGARLLGVDPALEMLRQASRALPDGSGVRFQQASAEALPFGDARFDLVFSTLTFHHWRDQRRGVAEVGRVLTPGGRWLLTDFMASGAMRLVRRLLRLKRFPERPAFDAVLAAAGLVVLAERRVPGLGGQVAVLAIGAGR